jgi:hypothetical protein
MSAIGGKTTLGLQGLAQTLQQMVDRVSQRIDFGRQARRFDRRQITHPTGLHRSTIGQYAAQADAHE